MMTKIRKLNKITTSFFFKVDSAAHISENMSELRKAYVYAEMCNYFGLGIEINFYETPDLFTKDNRLRISAYDKNVHPKDHTKDTMYGKMISITVEGDKSSLAAINKAWKLLRLELISIISKLCEDRDDQMKKLYL